jgi:hypothetical protein
MGPGAPLRPLRTTSAPPRIPAGDPQATLGPMALALNRGRRAVRRQERTFVFVSADEPLAAAQAVWSARTPVDLCVAGPSQAARDTAAFAVAGRPVDIVSEPLLAAPPVDEDAADTSVREADALLALYALDTKCALVVWDALDREQPHPVIVDEQWLLATAERIGRSVRIP